MRFLTLLALSASLATAQVTITYEPLPELSERVFGRNGFKIWNVILTTSDTAQHVLPRSLVYSMTTITELRTEQAEAELRRAAQLNGLGMAGRLWDSAAPLIGPGLVGYGFAKDSKASQWAGSGVAAISLIRALLRGTAPRAEDYITGLLPDRITCEAGSCGEWVVVTTDNQQGWFQLNAQLTAEVETLERIRRARLDVFGYAWD